ncbi:2-C-methyl-D-erythritol 4-phosphate cytidylyltransferase [Emticicia fluvialis]|uniref:2-C-methyl-D-erythritol 4-phosphate cytidylyltransferase n=1 Tax=Emticicia fluvialis TaxID=2974474 RepID=UPI002166BAF9|nr:2-C-methyl-D-erythritol 4-phosphate cytidylyltransferase [Emticicia fluvialis]
MEKQKFAVLVAGGSGSRMGSDIPKQFLPLSGKPILLHTIEKFLQVEGIRIILVLPEKDIEFWGEIISYEDFANPHLDSLQVVVGGKSRFQSVKNGLAFVPDDALVAIHDGVRPLIDIQTIKQSFDLAAESGSAVTSVPLKDSIRQIDDNGKNLAVERSKYRLMQTPQTFQSGLIKAAYSLTEQDSFTDCASVCEMAGYSVNLIDGAYENIKITTPEDMIVAEALLRNYLRQS